MTATNSPGAGSAATVIHGPGADHYAYRPLTGREPGRLPAEAAAQVRDMEDDAEELRILAEASRERVQTEREERGRVRNDIAEMERNYPGEIHGDAEYERTKRRAEAHGVRLAELNARYEEQTGRWQGRQRLLSGIAAFLKAHADLVIVPWSGPLPKPGKGETAEQAVSRLRARVAELRAEITRIENAPLPAAEAKANVRAYVAGLGERGRPDVSSAIGGIGAPAFLNLPSLPTRPAHHEGFQVDPGGMVNDGLALMAWAMPDVLIAALERDVDAAADDARAIPGADRDRLLDEAADALLAAERDEEAFHRMAVATGAAIERRPEADPRAVLMVDTVEAEPADDQLPEPQPYRPQRRRNASRGLQLAHEMRREVQGMAGAGIASMEAELRRAGIEQ